MKQKVGREWVDRGPARVNSSILSIVLPSRHSHGGAVEDDERSLYGITFPEPGRRPFQAGVHDKGDINMHETTS